MREQIIGNISNPQMIEELYRSNPDEFSHGFMDAYEQIKGQPLSEFWKIRLGFEPPIEIGDKILPMDAIPKEKTFNLVFTVIAALIAGSLIKLTNWLGQDNPKYIIDNLAFFVLPFLCIYYMVKNKAEAKNIVIFSVLVCASVLFMNLIPWQLKSDTRILSSLHIIFIMWVFVGLAYTGFNLSAREKQMQFLRRNGDVIMLTGIILICGMFLTALTAGLFQAIGLKLPEYVFENIAMFGIPSAPMAANYMIESSPKIINKVTPFISKIFTPLILALMTVFIIALVFFANDPFSSRQELIVFNVLLAVNLAVIVFSFSGNAEDVSKKGSFQNKILLVLSAEALIINLIALSAIVYRLFALGITPNRLAVLGVNVLMFVNLIAIGIKLWGYVKAKGDSESVHRSMTMMLPWYALWAAIAAFTFPFIFWFK